MRQALAARHIQQWVQNFEPLQRERRSQQKEGAAITASAHFICLDCDLEDNNLEERDSEERDFEAIKKRFIIVVFLTCVNNSVWIGA